jgi:hypothetical protein
MRELTQDEERRLWHIIDRASLSGTRWAGMTYEDGLRAVLELLNDDTTIEEIEDE